MVKVVKIRPNEWEKMGEDAHRAVFEETRPAYMNRIDYALLVTDLEDKVLGYGTVREFDNESAYIQYAGRFDPVTAHQAVEVFSSGLEWLLKRYKRITCLSKNENIRFLKLAFHLGFRIIGCRTFKNEIFVELLNEVKE